MSSREERAEIRAEREKRYADEAKDFISRATAAMSECKSPYIKPNKLLGIANDRVLSKPKSAIRPAKKAFLLASKESRIALSYSDLIYRLTDDASSPNGKKIKSISEKYQAAMAKGNLSKAERLVSTMLKTAALAEYTTVMDMVMQPSTLKPGENECDLVISSLLEKSITINGIEYSSNGAEVSCETVMSRPLPAKSHIAYKVKIVTLVPDSVSVRVIVRYTIDTQSEKMQKSVFDMTIVG